MTDSFRSKLFCVTNWLKILKSEKLPSVGEEEEDDGIDGNCSWKGRKLVNGVEREIVDENGGDELNVGDVPRADEDEEKGDEVNREVDIGERRLSILSESIGE